MTYLHMFSHIWHLLHTFALNSNLFVELSASVVIGQSYYFAQFI